MKNTRFRTVIPVFLIPVAIVVEAAAVPVQFGANHYEFVAVADPFTGSNNSWFTADAAAAASVHLGVSGHLATVTSQAENDFLLSLVPAGAYTGFAGAWLGGKSPEGWLRGPEAGNGFSYTYWAGVEPNNSGYAYLSIGGGYGAGGQWADDSFTQGFPDGADPVVGYFVEYEGTASRVPDGGATAALLAWVLVGLAALSSRARKPQRRT